MVFRCAAGLLLWLAVVLSSAARADAPPGFEGLEDEVGKISAVPVTAGLPVLANPSAVDRAMIFAGVISKAEAHFARELGWKLPFRMLVLGRADWEKITPVPYPAPHVWNGKRLILMPESLRDYPGFETWGFDDVQLNAILTVHEVGHALADENGLKWDNVNRSLHELLANIMMASFIHAEHPGMARLLDGVPAGFGPSRAFTMEDFNAEYISLGLRDYAWFQFEVAKAAGIMSRAKPLQALMAEISTELGQSRGMLGDREISNLDRIAPGTADALANLKGSRRWAAAQIGPCTGRIPPLWSDRTIGIAIENHTEQAIRVRDPLYERELDQMDAEFFHMWDEQGPYKPKPREANVIPAGHGWGATIPPGSEIAVEGQGCITSPDAPRVLVIRGE